MSSDGIERETVEDWKGIEAPASVDGVDLRDADECPVCESRDGYIEGPAGYYTCTSCYSTWAGDIRKAEIVDYINTAEDLIDSNRSRETGVGR